LQKLKVCILELLSAEIVDLEQLCELVTATELLSEAPTKMAAAIEHSNMQSAKPAQVMFMMELTNSRKQVIN